MTLSTILEDEREIERLSFGTGPADVSIVVGLAGVTKIVAYGEPGQGAYVPYFAVYIGEHLNDRVPAHMVVVSYKEAST